MIKMATALLLTNCAYANMCKLRVNVTHTVLDLDKGKITVKPHDMDIEISENKYNQLKIGDKQLIKVDQDIGKKEVLAHIIDKLGCDKK